MQFYAGHISSRLESQMRFTDENSFTFCQKRASTLLEEVRFEMFCLLV